MSQRHAKGAADVGRLQERLAELDVRSKWHGWDDGSLVVETPDGDEVIIPNEESPIADAVMGVFDNNPEPAEGLPIITCAFEAGVEEPFVDIATLRQAQGTSVAELQENYKRSAEAWRSYTRGVPYGSLPAFELQLSRWRRLLTWRARRRVRRQVERSTQYPIE